MLRKKETRGRGARYGALAGLLSVFLMCVITMLASGVYSAVFTGTSLGENIFDIIGSMLFVIFGLFFYALLFGGFLAIPFGAIAGFVLTTDPKAKPR